LDPVDDLVRRDRVVRAEDRNLPPGGSGPLRRQADRLVVNVVILVRRQDLVSRLQREAVINQREPGRGVAGKREVAGIRAGIASQRCRDQIVGSRVVLEHAPLDREERILVEAPAKPLDGVADRPGMGREVEQTQVDVGVIEIELLPH
jgi:hypothetical protein